MGYINFKDPNGVAKEREERTRLADERRTVPLAKEFERIKKIQEQQKLQQLRIFDYIDGEIGVRFGVGFNDPKTYYSINDLKK